MVASVLMDASMASASFAGPPKRSSVSGGRNLIISAAVPGGMPAKCTLSTP